MKRNLSIVLSCLAFAGCLYLGTMAHATVYGGSNMPTFHISLATRPAVVADLKPMSMIPAGKCKNGGGAPNCPHNGETDLFRPTVAKTAGGVTMVGWNWVTCGQQWDAATSTNYYFFVFAPGAAPNWPAVLPTGCGGGPCPQWPATVTCNLTGDNPPGPDNWTGHSVVQTVDIGAADANTW